MARRGQPLSKGLAAKRDKAHERQRQVWTGPLDFRVALRDSADQSYQNVLRETFWYDRDRNLTSAQPLDE